MKNYSVKIIAVLIMIGFLMGCTYTSQPNELKNDLLYDDVRVSYMVAQDEWPAEEINLYDKVISRLKHNVDVMMFYFS